MGVKTTDNVAAAPQSLLDQIPCLTEGIVKKYVTLSDSFTQSVGDSLLIPMWSLFVALVSLWVLIQVIRVLSNQTTLVDFGKEFFFVLLAAFMLGGSGTMFVNKVYMACLSMMAGAANVALKVGQIGSSVTAENANLSPKLFEGMSTLTCTVEEGMKQVLNMGSLISQTASLTDPGPWLYSLLLVIPYLLVVIVYFSLVVVAIFRVMMISVLSPFLMLGFGFGWGRNMLPRGMQALVGTFMVLFGGTAAVSVLLYSVSSLDMGNVTVESVRGMASLSNSQFLLTLLMGWMATAFMAEATGVSNSITDGSFTNTSSAILTAGISASGMALAKNPALSGLLQGSSNALGKLGDLGANNLNGAGSESPSDLVEKMDKG